jgi:regulator of RNase E activity RraA
MAVRPGDIIHMDENGACTFPAAHLAAVLDNARALREEELGRIGDLQQAASAEEVRAIFARHAYAAAGTDRHRRRTR